MSVISYCECCQKKLSQLGELANSMFEQICEHYILNAEYLEFSTSEYSQYLYLLGVLEYLELNHYIVTHERGNDLLLVKPLGINWDKDDDDFTKCHICFDVRHDF